ncbi:MAG: nucleoside 2-deoxyribosyltransferase [Candidatus Micrarchaeia archaeon]
MLLRKPKMLKRNLTGMTEAKRKLMCVRPKTEKPIVKAYLANQFGFSETGRYILYNKIRPRLVSIGLTINDPFVECSKEIDPKTLAEIKIADRHSKMFEFWQEFNRKITVINNRLMQDSDCMLAVLDGGADIDSGVASEIGYYACLRRGPIFALRSDFRLSENIATSINSQVLGYIEMSKGVLVDSNDSSPMESWFSVIERWYSSFMHRKAQKKG